MLDFRRRVWIKIQAVLFQAYLVAPLHIRNRKQEISIVKGVHPPSLPSPPHNRPCLALKMATLSS